MNTLLKITLAMILFYTIPANAGEAAQQGRYQIVINPSAGGVSDLLDTWTGKVWQQTKLVDMDGEPTVWLFMDKIDNDEQFDAWIKNHPSKKDVAADKELEKRNQSKEESPPVDLLAPPRRFGK